MLASFQIGQKKTLYRPFQASWLLYSLVSFPNNLATTVYLRRLLLNIWNIHLGYHLFSLCLSSFFGLSSPMQFHMHCGSCCVNSLLNRHWTIYLVHLPDPFCLVNFFLISWSLKPPYYRHLLNLQVFFHSCSTSMDGNFTKILPRNVPKSNLSILHEQPDADAVQIVALSRSRPSLGFGLFFFDLSI